MNKITDASNSNRNKWAAMLPFISQTINRTHLSSAKGLSRAQLLFSPYIQMSGLPSEDLFTIQETIFKRILSNRQKILTDRQLKFKTGNHKVSVGNLVFKKNEVFDNVVFPKNMPSQKDLFMIIHIPQPKKRDSNLY